MHIEVENVDASAEFYRTLFPVAKEVSWDDGSATALVFPDGTAFPPTAGGRFPDMTCSNWTNSGEGRAMLGHHDRSGPTGDAWAVSWNSAHPTIGCSQDALTKTGGAGLLYCFAAK